MTAARALFATLVLPPGVAASTAPSFGHPAAGNGHGGHA
jgi:hypothetical protein